MATPTEQPERGHTVTIPHVSDYKAQVLGASANRSVGSITGRDTTG